MSKTKAVLVLILGIGGIAAGAVYWWKSQPNIRPAQVAMDAGDYREARRLLDEYLDARPDDTAAKLMWAEATLADRSALSPDSLKQTYEVLDQIPDSDDAAVAARVRQAEIMMTMTRHLEQAEQMARRAIALDPTSGKANSLLWSIMQLTQRFHLAEPYFRAAHEAAEAGNRSVILRDWFLSQFFPGQMTVAFDRTLNIAPGPNAEMQRTAILMQQDPAATTPRAALAAMYLRSSGGSTGGAAKEALEYLTADEVDRSRADPFYTAMLVETLLVLGEHDRAVEEFTVWRGEKSGYLYDRAAGLVAEEVDADFAKAAKSYEAALTNWPGPVDVRTRRRYAACLRKSKQPDAADKILATVDETEALLQSDTFRKLGLAARTPNTPESAKQFAEFYRQLGRPQEAKLWEAIAANPIAPPTGKKSAGPAGF